MREKQNKFVCVPFNRMNYFQGINSSAMRILSEDFYGWEGKAFWSDQHVINSEYLLVFGLLISSSILCQQALSKITFFPSAAVAMTVGIAAGIIIRLSINYTSLLRSVEDLEGTTFNPTSLGFSNRVFFFGFLPPIIFNSGYHLKRKLFFAHFGGIMSLAFAGTIVATTLMATTLYYLTRLFTPIPSMSVVECVAFAAVLSSTDPVATLAVYSKYKVDPTLFYLVFGESVLNDAIAITIFNVTSKLLQDASAEPDIVACFVNFVMLIIGSWLIGYLSGLVLAFILKQFDFSQESLTPVGVIVCSVYMPFLFSEMLQLSGIVTIFFAGISSRKYVRKVISESSAILSSKLFQILAHLSETACFTLLGVSVMLYSIDIEQFPFIFSVLASCFLVRGAQVYPMLSMVTPSVYY